MLSSLCDLKAETKLLPVITDWLESIMLVNISESRELVNPKIQLCFKSRIHVYS